MSEIERKSKLLKKAVRRKTMELINKKSLQELIEATFMEMKPTFEEHFTGSKGKLSKDELKALEKAGRQHYYNATEACQFLGVSQATFWKWKKKYPELNPIMVDGICRFAREDLINFMNEKRK